VGRPVTMPENERNIEIGVAMARLGMNSRLLSEATGIAESSLSLIINGKRNPKTETRAIIAAALGCDVNEIFQRGNE